MSVALPACWWFECLRGALVNACLDRHTSLALMLFQGHWHQLLFSVCSFLLGVLFRKDLTLGSEKLTALTLLGGLCEMKSLGLSPEASRKQRSTLQLPPLW